MDLKNKMFKLSRLVINKSVQNSVEKNIAAPFILNDVFNRSMYMGLRKPPRQRTLYESPTSKKDLEKAEKSRIVKIPNEYRHIYPEFLPDPKMEWRNPIREKIERLDMLDRRTHIDVPEFYVGSVLSVITSDPHSIGKTSKFVGLCIDRDRCGLRARFILRNVVDHQGIEVAYDIYDPTIQRIEVLRLEKRPDSQLFYLRDALPEYSTFDLNMEPEILPEGEPVPVNPIKVEMKPRPWLERWERQNLEGVANIEEMCKPKHLASAKLRQTPWEKYDLMKEYRRSIPEEEQIGVYSEIYPKLNEIQKKGKLQRRKRTFNKSKQ